MKKIASVLVLMLVITGCVWAADKTGGSISFEKTTYDFGNIREDGGKVTHEFQFTNKGSSPIKIIDARAECGCTRPEFSKKEIAPGASGTIKVTYNPLGRPGGFTKVVTVKCTGNPGKVKLKIRGTVLPK